MMFRRIETRQARHTRLRPVAALTAALVVLILITVLTPGGAQAQPPDEDPNPNVASAAYTGPVSSANARFVVGGYSTLLGRQPETAGLDFHLSRLAAGGARNRLAFTYSLLFSVEGSRGEVARAYGDLLGRQPETAGRTYWTDHLTGHGVVDLRVLLLASEEYRNRAGGTDRAWLDAVYLDVLGRAPDTSGLTYWLERAEAGIPRALITAAIYQSDEALGRRAVAHYQEVLGRVPSTGERDGAVATIRRIGERGLRAQILASDEAYETHLRAALS